MSIVFFCQSCGSRFEVPPQSAGKRGRCKKCGQHVVVPRAEGLASMVALPAVAAAPAGPAAAVATPVAVAPWGATPVAPKSVSDWLRAAATSVGLSPLTVSSLPLSARNPKPSPLDDAEDSKPYLVAGRDPYESHVPGAHAAAAAVGLWRREVGLVQRTFRWLNESAYLVSIPFIGIFLFGAATKSRGLALFGATFVVLLNLGRIVAGVANVAVIPLRSGLNTKKMKKPFRRVLEPVATIAIVFLAFTFVPWLASKRPTGGTLVERLEGSAESLGGEMKGELESDVEKAKSVKAADLEKLGAEARERLRTIGTGPGDGAGAAPPADVVKPSPEAGVEGLIKNLGERGRDTVKESQQP
jgi:hypothetical protein